MQTTQGRPLRKLGITFRIRDLMSRLQAEEQLERRLCVQVRGVRRLRGALVQAALAVDLAPLTIIEDRLEQAISLLRLQDPSRYTH